MSDEQFIDDIIDRLAEQLGVDRGDFFTRKNSHSRYKFGLFYILRHRTTWSLAKIANSLDGNYADTSNVAHAIKTVSSSMTLYWKGIKDPYCEAVEKTLKQTTNLLSYEIGEPA